MRKNVPLIAFLILGVYSEFDPKQHVNWKLLENDICGQSTSQRIIGGEEAPMNGYPWIARIGYLNTDTQDMSFRCGGVIANSKTVLTAAHCVTGLPKEYKIGLVRFGEHNTETDPDCDGDFCADPVLDIKPSEIIIPKNYNDPPFKHDIALIRLRNEIKFSDYVKPICFPSGELIKRDLVGSTTEVAGWGIYDVDNSKTSTKLQVVKLPVIENEKCKSYLPNNANIGPTQLCVGGQIGKDSCGGDSGGPLMMVDDEDGEPRYYLLGVVSFGSKKCGKTNMPGVYTKMSDYMEWFLNNLEKKNSESTKIL